jgi:hypothetical protein
MPYVVESFCDNCNQGDSFTIGYWAESRGVFVCTMCKIITDIPLETGSCPGCGYVPRNEEYYDYSLAIPYPYGEQNPNNLEPGPVCPNCWKYQLTFPKVSHFKLVGMQGNRKDGNKPWWGLDYLEKAIFVHALMSICKAQNMDPQKMLNYYNVDVPISLMKGRNVSQPILKDIQGHFFSLLVLDKFKENYKNE